MCGGKGGGDPTPDPGKSQVYLGFPRNTATDPLEKQLASNCFSSEVRTTLCKKYTMMKKNLPGSLLPPIEFS